MATPVSVPTIANKPDAIPAWLLNVCFVLFVINAAFFPTAYFAHWWIFDQNGHGLPVDFVNVWSAGRLALDGHPAQAGRHAEGRVTLGDDWRFCPRCASRRSV